MGVQRSVDLRGNRLATEYNQLLNEIPEEEETIQAMLKVKDSAPGKDGVIMSYITRADLGVKLEIIKMLQVMFTSQPSKWEESLKVGYMVLYLKKETEISEGTIEGSCCWPRVTGFLPGFSPVELDGGLEG